MDMQRRQRPFLDQSQNKRDVSSKNYGNKTGIIEREGGIRVLEI